MFIRLLRLLLKDKLNLVLVLFLLIFSIILQSFSPIVLGDGINILYDGFKSGHIRFDLLLNCIIILFLCTLEIIFSIS